MNRCPSSSKILNVIVATRRVEPSVLVFFGVYLENGKQSMLQPMYSCTTYTVLERSFLKCIWVVALIVCRFRDKRRKHQHRRLNSYRGDYTTKCPTDLTKTSPSLRRNNFKSN